MFSLFKKTPRAAASSARWTVAVPERHAFLAFGGDDLADRIADARAALDARLADASADNREALGGDTDIDGFLKDADAALGDRIFFDLEGRLAAWIAANLTVAPLDVASARSELPERDVLAGVGLDAARGAALDRATCAARIGAPVAALAYGDAPFALLALAAGVADEPGCVAYDCLGIRIVVAAAAHDPLAGLEYRAAGEHARVLAIPLAGGAHDYVTVGLQKFGVFEIGLRGVPAGIAHADLLVAGLAQAVLDARPFLAGPWNPERFDVSYNDVLTFFNSDDDFDKRAKSVTLTVNPSADDPGVWNVAGPHHDLRPDDLSRALETLRVANGLP